MRSSTETHKRRAALSKIKKVATELTHDYGYASFVMDAHIIHPSGRFVNNFSVFFEKVFKKKGQHLRFFTKVIGERRLYIIKPQEKYTLAHDDIHRTSCGDDMPSLRLGACGLDKKRTKQVLRSFLVQARGLESRRYDAKPRIFRLCYAPRSVAGLLPLPFKSP